MGIMDWPLFLSALLSSTLLPGGSEALLLLRLGEGNGPWGVVIVATAGNMLGSLITYGMGRLGNEALHRRWFRVSERDIERAENGFARFGKPALLFAWLPVVGDPLCLVAGLLSFPVAGFLLLVTLGKFARYAVLGLPYFLA